MLEKSTPGPWEYVADYLIRRRGKEPSGFCTHLGGATIYSDDDVVVNDEVMKEADAVFIASAPSIISQLLDEREEVRKKLEEIRWEYEPDLEVVLALFDEKI